MAATASILTLTRNLRRAKAKASSAHKARRAAEVALAKALDARDAAQERLAEAKLLAWGDKPKVRQLLTPQGLGATNAFHNALAALASSFGLQAFGEWVDTEQTSLTCWICDGTKDEKLAAVKRVASGVRFFAPAMKASEPTYEMVRFALRTKGEEGRWSLLYSPSVGLAKLECRSSGGRAARLEFSSLEIALRYVAATLAAPREYVGCEKVAGLALQA